MMDIVEELRRYDSNGTAQWKAPARAADEIERLRAEVLEQCRLNAMGSEREARLMAQLTERDDELNRIGHQLHQMAVNLAESQARERMMVDGLDESWVTFPENAWATQPPDSAALDAMLKAERAKERERIAMYVESERMKFDAEHGRHDPDTGAFEFDYLENEEYSSSVQEIADAIRALGDE